MTDPVSPSHADILKAAFARLSGDSALSALMGGRIYNHLPQDLPTPCMRVRWASSTEWDTKDSAGVDGEIVVDIWTDYRGDLSAYAAVDRVVALMHLEPFSLTGSQSLVLRRDRVASFTEPDGITHHTAVTFLHIAST